MSSVLISSALGLAIGLILALTGAGGGILAVPLLVFGAHLSLPQAAPIALLAVGMAAALGAVLGLSAGLVRYKASFLIAAVGIIFAPLGLWLARQIDGPLLGALFAAVLLLVAYRTLRQSRDPLARERHIDAPDGTCIRDAASGRFIWTTRCTRALALSGAGGNWNSERVLRMSGLHQPCPAVHQFCSARQIARAECVRAVSTPTSSGCCEMEQVWRDVCARCIEPPPRRRGRDFILQAALP